MTEPRSPGTTVPPHASSSCYGPAPAAVCGSDPIMAPRITRPPVPATAMCRTAYGISAARENRSPCTDLGVGVRRTTQITPPAGPLPMPFICPRPRLTRPPTVRDASYRLFAGAAPIALALTTNMPGLHVAPHTSNCSRPCLTVGASRSMSASAPAPKDMVYSGPFAQATRCLPSI